MHSIIISIAGQFRRNIPQISTREQPASQLVGPAAAAAMVAAVTAVAAVIAAEVLLHFSPFEAKVFVIERMSDFLFSCRVQPPTRFELPTVTFKTVGLKDCAFSRFFVRRKVHVDVRTGELTSEIRLVAK